MFKFKTHRRTPSASIGPARALIHSDNKICRGNPPMIFVLMCIVGSCWLVVDYWKTQAQILNSLRLMHVDIKNDKPVYIWSSTHQNNKTRGKNKGRTSAISVSQTRAVYLVKVHKAASTTLQMIMNRFAVTNQLKVASFNSPFGMPFPKVASKLLLYEDPIQAKFQPYDILHEHAVYDSKTVEGYMRPGYKLIGSIREPLSQIRSLFSYFELPKRYGIVEADEPVEKFLENPELYKGKPKYEMMKNGQAQHYGYQLYKNKKNVADFIKHIENRFDMILVTEKLDACLILMKRKFSWSLSDIMYLPRHTQKSKSKKLSKVRERKVVDSYRAYSPVDHDMYKYFSDKLNAELANQTSEFWQQLDNFKSIKESFNKFCVTMCDVAKELGALNTTQAKHLMDSTSFHVPGSFGEEDLTLTYADCILLSMSSMNWHIAIKIKQFPDLFCSAKTRGLKEKSTYYDPYTEEIKEDHQGAPRAVSPHWCNDRYYLVDHFPSRTVFLDLFTRQTTNEIPFCIL